MKSCFAHTRGMYGEEMKLDFPSLILVSFQKAETVGNLRPNGLM